MYICIYSNRDGELILFHHEGGIDIGDVDSKALTYMVPIDESYNANQMETALLKHVPADRRPSVEIFLSQNENNATFSLRVHLGTYRRSSRNYSRSTWTCISPTWKSIH